MTFCRLWPWTILARTCGVVCGADNDGDGRSEDCSSFTITPSRSSYWSVLRVRSRCPPTADGHVRTHIALACVYFLRHCVRRATEPQLADWLARSPCVHQRYVTLSLLSLWCSGYRVDFDSDVGHNEIGWACNKLVVVKLGHMHCIKSPWVVVR